MYQDYIYGENKQSYRQTSPNTPNIILLSKSSKSPYKVKAKKKNVTGVTGGREKLANNYFANAIIKTENKSMIDSVNLFLTLIKPGFNL